MLRKFKWAKKKQLKIKDKGLHREQRRGVPGGEMRDWGGKERKLGLRAQTARLYVTSASKKQPIHQLFLRLL